MFGYLRIGEVTIAVVICRKFSMIIVGGCTVGGILLLPVLFGIVFNPLFCYKH